MYPNVNLILICYDEAAELNFLFTHLLETCTILQSLKEYLNQSQVFVRIPTSKWFPAITCGYTMYRMTADICDIDDLPTKLGWAVAEES
jgi:hypothetical protein